jgi:DNA-binding MarR family transcriptional regulator
MASTDGQEQLSELLMRSARAMRRRWSDSLAPWDLSPHQARALRVVHRHDAARMGTIAAHLRIAPRSVTEVLDALEERGLVRRVPDPTDRRAVLVELTDHGRALLVEVDEARDGASAAYLSVLSQRDQAQLARLLRTLDPDGPSTTP